MKPSFASLGILLAALSGSMFTSGCASCSPEQTDVAVTLSLIEEEVRTLPMLISGGTTMAGVAVPIPDSHGFAEVRVKSSHPDVDNFEVRDFELEFKAGTASLPVRIVEIDGGNAWTQGDDDSTGWSGSIYTEDELKIWWTVDSDQVGKLADVVLPEGAAYTLTVDFDWEHDSCSYFAKGHTRTPITDHVMASVNAKTFESSGDPIIETGADGVGFQADYGIKSGLTVTLRESSALTLYVAQKPTTAGVAVFPGVGWTVNGVPGSTVKPDDVLETFSKDAGLTASGYAKSGKMVPPTLVAGKGLYILVTEISYTSADTVGSQKDTFAFGIVES